MSDVPQIEPVPDVDGSEVGDPEYLPDDEEPDGDGG